MKLAGGTDAQEAKEQTCAATEEKSSAPAAEATTGAPSVVTSVQSGAPKEEPSSTTSITVTKEAAVEDKPCLKKTCEPCVRSKVRCSGATPCDRCVGRGFECYFVAEQKRGRRPGTTIVRTSEGKKRALLSKEEEKETPCTPAIRSDITPPPVMLAGVTHPFVNPPILTSPFNAMNLMLMAGASRPLPSLSAPMTLPGITPPFAGHWPLISASPIPSLGSQFLGHTERRITRVLFALYRMHQKASYASEQQKQLAFTWFDARFCLLRTLLSPKLTPDEHRMLTIWMMQNNLRLEGTHADSIVDRTVLDIPGEVGKPIDGENMPSGVFLGSFNVSCGIPVETDETLDRCIGCNSATFTKHFWTLNSFLPLGSDAIVDLVATDEDVLAFTLDVGLPMNKELVVHRKATSPTRRFLSREVRVVNQRDGSIVNCRLSAEELYSASTYGRQAACIKFWLANTTNSAYASARGDLAMKLGMWPLQSLIMTM